MSNGLEVEELVPCLYSSMRLGSSGSVPTEFLPSALRAAGIDAVPAANCHEPLNAA